MRARVLVLFLLLLASGTASAFPGAATHVDIAYALGTTPIALSKGHLELAGDVQEILLTAGHNESRIGPIPLLTLVTIGKDGSFQNETFTDATLVVHTGTLVLRLEENERQSLAIDAPYGLGIGIPNAPFGERDENATQRPGVLLAATDIFTTFSWATRPVDLIFLDATVSVLDKGGTPASTWDHRRINENASVQNATSGGDFQEGTLVRAEGNFNVHLHSAAVAAALGNSPNMTMAVTQAKNDRYLDALDAFVALGASMGNAEAMQGPADALKKLESFAGILNGAIILMTPPAEDGSKGVHPLVAYIRGNETELGSFAFMRSEDIKIGWQETEMRIAGRSAVAITGAGASVDPPALVGPIPLITAVLYAMAAASIVVLIVRRPPKGNPSILIRLGSAAFGIGAAVVVFYLWDVAFAQTFGTSFLTQASSEAFTSDRLAELGSIFALQTLPWGIAVLAFALPTRIIFNVGLRYFGYGKSLKGVATAAGFGALAIFGPSHALWLTNMMMGYLFDLLPAIPGF